MKRVLGLIITLFFVVSCQTDTNRITRVSYDTTTDLTGRWNDTDSRLVSESMISDLLGRDVFEDLELELGHKPVLIVGRIRNKTSEHINVTSFIKDMERELVNSRVVKVVASSEEREELRDEIFDQQSNSSLESMKMIAQETGADLMLIGSIISMSEKLNDVQAVYYQVDLELIGLETTEKIWIGSNKHKKIIKLGGTEW